MPSPTVSSGRNSKLMIPVASVEGERDVTVFRLPGDIAANPIRRLESRAAFLIIEFHFGHNETVVPAPINIDLNRVGFPRHIVANLGQSATDGGRPEGIELFEAQTNLTFFPFAFCPLLESKRADGAFFAQTNLKAAGPNREIALFDDIMREFL